MRRSAGMVLLACLSVPAPAQEGEPLRLCRKVALWEADAVDLAMSHDGSCVAVQSRDGSVRIFGTEQGTLVGELAFRRPGDGEALALLRRGNVVGIATRDAEGRPQVVDAREVRVRQAGSALDPAELRGPPVELALRRETPAARAAAVRAGIDDASCTLALQDRAGRVTAVLQRDGGALIVVGGRRIALAADTFEPRIALSADGRFLAFATPFGICFVDLDTGARQTLAREGARDLRLCSGLVGPEIVFAERDRIVFWNASLGRAVREVTCPGFDATAFGALRVDALERHVLALANGRAEVPLVSMIDGDTERVELGDGVRVVFESGVQIAADGRVLLAIPSVSRGGVSVGVLRIAAPGSAPREIELPIGVRNVDVLPSGRRVFASGPGVLAAVDLDDGRIVGVGKRNAIHAVALGERAALAVGPRRAWIETIPGFTTVTHVDLDDARDLVATPDRRRVAILCRGHVAVYDVDASVRR